MWLQEKNLPFFLCKAKITLIVDLDPPQPTGLAMISVDTSTDLIIKASELFDFPNSVEFKT